MIKAERFESLDADPDLLAPAFVEALSRMKAEGAAAERILAVSDYFFENYPFSIRDLPVPEEPFLAVAGFRHDAAMRITAEIPACSEVRKATTVAELEALLEEWQEPHEDGGRCAYRFYQAFRSAVRRGFEIDLDPGLLKWGEDQEPYSHCLSSLFRAARPALGSSPWYAAAAFPGARVDSWTAQQRRHTGWLEYSDLGYETRWARMYWFRALAWDSVRHSSELVFDGVAEPMESSRFDVRLRTLGLAVRRYMEKREGEDPSGWLKATEDLIRASIGTPIADRARLQAVLILREKTPLAAERWLQGHLADFDRPFLAAHSLLALTLDAPSAKKIELAEAAVRLDPAGPSAISAWSILADAYESDGKLDKMEACLIKSLALGPFKTGEFEDDAADFARSESARKLARLLQSQKKWAEALAAWRNWESYSECATCSWSQEDDKNVGIAGCLEALGRVAESVDYYWEASISQSAESVEVARKLVQVHQSLGTRESLKDRVRKEVESYEDRSRVKFGLKWLADELGVPVK